MGDHVPASESEGQKSPIDGPKRTSANEDVAADLACEQCINPRITYREVLPGVIPVAEQCGEVVVEGRSTVSPSLSCEPDTEVSANGPTNVDSALGLCARGKAGTPWNETEYIQQISVKQAIGIFVFIGQKPQGPDVLEIERIVLPTYSHRRYESPMRDENMPKRINAEVWRT
jgi:hypothetical protein